MANTLTLSANIDTTQMSRTLREFERTRKVNFEVNDRSITQPLGKIRTGVDQINASLDAANQRVITFAASAVLLGGVTRAFVEVLSATVAVEKAMVDINSVFNLSANQLNKFSKEVFNIARETAQSFDTVSKAALEFSRQGLGVEETSKRLRAALILTRLSGLDATKSVDAITVAINGFSRENLKASEILNKLVAVDSKFAVSTADLTEALSRVGSTAQDAGISFDELLGLVTSLQQTTARGGSVIGNALKTIFTKVRNPEVLTQLDSFGIKVKDMEGNTLSAINILRNIGERFDSLTESQKASVSQMAAGIYQINQFSAGVKDLGRSYNFVEQATRAAASASVEAEKRNAALNKSLDSQLKSYKETLREVSSVIGEIAFRPAIESVIGSSLMKDVLDSIKNANVDDVSQDTGGKIAEGMLNGISNVLKGPGFVAILATATAVIGRTYRVIRDDIAGLILARGKEADTIKGINVLLSAASQKDKDRLQLASSIAQKEQIVLEILAKQNALRAQQAAQQSGLANAIRHSGGGSSVSKLGRLGTFSPNFANPLRDAVAREVKAGVNPRDIYIDSDPRVKSQKNPLGLLIANKRDEPLGGFQGVQRAIQQGINPKTYGTVPNFAEFDKLEGTISKNATIPVPISILPEEAKQLRSVFGKLRTVGAKSLDEFKVLSSEIASLSASFNLTDESMVKINSKVAKVAVRLNTNAVAAEAERRAGDLAFKAGELANKKRAADFDKAQSQLPKQSVPSQPKTTKKAKELTFDQKAAQILGQGNQADAGSPFNIKSNPEYKAYLDELAQLDKDKQTALLKQVVAQRKSTFLAGQTSYSAPIGPERFRGVTDIEEGLRKQVTELSNKQISAITGSNFNNIKRGDNIFNARTIFDEPITKGGRVNAGRVGGLLDLAKSGTLETDFDNSVRKLVTSGSTLKDAYLKASAELLKGGGTAAQLNTAQLEYANKLTQFSKEVDNQRASIKGVVATRNLSGAIESKGITGLNRDERRQLTSGVRGSVTKELFAGYDPDVLKADKDAQRLIFRETKKRISNLKREALEVAADETADKFVLANQGGGFRRNFQNDADTFIAANPNLSRKAQQRIRERAVGLQEQRRQNISNRAIQASFLVPFAAGFIPGGEGGTRQGKIGGAISGAATGFGIGASVGTATLHPLGVAVGATAGTVIGGITGLVGKLSQSFEELSQSINNINSSYSQQIDAVGQYIQLQQKVNDAVKEGTSEKELQGLIGDQFHVLQRIKDPLIRSQILAGGTDITAISQAGRGLSEKAIKVGTAGGVQSSLNKFSDENSSKNILDAANALAVATDRSSEKVNEAFSVFRSTFEDDPSKAFRLFAENFGLAGTELDNTVKSLEKRPNDLKFLFKLFVENSDEFVKNLKVSTENYKKTVQSAGLADLGKNLSRTILTNIKLLESNLSSAINLDKIFSEARLTANAATPEGQITGRADQQIRENRARNENQVGSLLQTIKAELVTLTSQESGAATLGAGGNELLAKLSTLSDLKQLIPLSDKTTQGLLEDVVDQIIIQNNIAANTEKEISAQKTNDLLRLKLEQRNAALRGGVFNQDTLSSFRQARGESRLSGGGDLNVRGKLGMSEILTELGLPELDDEELVRNALRERSGRQTYAKVLSEILRVEVGESEEELSRAVNDILKGSYGDQDKRAAQRVSKGLTLVKESPEASLAALASGKTSFSDLLSSGKISTDTGVLGTSFEAIGKKLDPLVNIQTYTGDMAQLMGEFVLKGNIVRQGVTQEERVAGATRKLGALNADKTRAENNIIDIVGLNELKRSNTFTDSLSGNEFTINQDVEKVIEYIGKRLEAGGAGTNIPKVLEGLDSKIPISGVGLTLADIRKLFTDLAPEETKRPLEVANKKIRDAEFEQQYIRSGETPLKGAFRDLSIGEIGQFGVGARKQSAKQTDPAFRFFKEKGVAAKSAAESSEEEAKQTAEIYKHNQLSKEALSAILKNKEDSYTVQDLELDKLKEELDILNEQRPAYDKLTASSRLRLEYENKILQNSLETARITGDSAKTFTTTIKSRFNEMRQEMTDFSDVADTVFDSFSDNAANAFGDFVTGTKTGKEAFRSFVLSVLNDAARAFASKAVQGIIGNTFGAFFADGGPVKMANGGSVPALLMGGEYYVSPRSASAIGRDTLDRLNAGTLPKYANGGSVMGGRNFYVAGGSGVKDDVPANLSPGGYVLKKNAVNKYSKDYLDRLTSGKVEKKIWGGLIGALVGAGAGAGIGYAVGGRRGALIGAGIGAAGGAFIGAGGFGGASSAAPSAVNSPSTAASYAAFPAGSATPVGVLGNGGLQEWWAANSAFGGAAGGAGSAIAPALTMKGIALSLGASVLLGAGVSAMSKTKGAKPLSAEEISQSRLDTEAANQGGTPYAYMRITPQGDYERIGSGPAIATRRFAEGGPVQELSSMVSSATPMGLGEVGSGPAIADSSYKQNGFNIIININKDGSSASSSTEGPPEGMDRDWAMKMGKFVESKVSEVLMKESRQGGFFAQKKRQGF